MNAAELPSRTKENELLGLGLGGSDVFESLSEADKKLLGFEVVKESGGAIAPRSPGDVRTNTNFRSPYVPELRRQGAKHAVPKSAMGPIPRH